MSIFRPLAADHRARVSVILPDAPMTLKDFAEAVAGTLALLPPALSGWRKFLQVTEHAGRKLTPIPADRVDTTALLMKAGWDREATAPFFPMAPGDQSALPESLHVDGHSLRLVTPAAIWHQGFGLYVRAGAQGEGLPNLCTVAIPGAWPAIKRPAFELLTQLMKHWSALAGCVTTPGFADALMSACGGDDADDVALDVGLITLALDPSEQRQAVMFYPDHSDVDPATVDMGLDARRRLQAEGRLPRRSVRDSTVALDPARRGPLRRLGRGTPVETGGFGGLSQLNGRRHLHPEAAQDVAQEAARQYMQQVTGVPAGIEYRMTLASGEFQFFHGVSGRVLPTVVAADWPNIHRPLVENQWDVEALIAQARTVAKLGRRMLIVVPFEADAAWFRAVIRDHGLWTARVRVEAPNAEVMALVERVGAGDGDFCKSGE